MSKSKADLAKLLSMVDGNDLSETINQLGFMLGNPDKGQEIKSKLSTLLSQNFSEQKSLQRKMSHVDPATNLLLALKPYLSQTRQDTMEQYLRAVNVSTFIRQVGEMQRQLENEDT